LLYFLLFRLIVITNESVVITRTASNPADFSRGVTVWVSFETALGVWVGVAIGVSVGLVDGPPALSLSVEPLEKDSMIKPPRNPREQILTKEMSGYIITAGFIMAMGTLGIFVYMIDKPQAQTLAFTTSAILVHAAIVYLPQVMDVFGTVPLSLWDWLLSAATASIIFIAFEIYKCQRTGFPAGLSIPPGAPKI